jgi:hypothetical protein
VAGAVDAVGCRRRKKAFCNYYVLVIAALVLAIGARRAERDGGTSPITPA